jgi:hypothetical protein
MRLFDCQVRLAGDLNHVVPRYAVTEQEILMLRNLHGNDAVVRIKQVGDAKDRTEAEELQRLALLYSQDRVEKLFMVKLDLNAFVADDDDDDEDFPAPAASAEKKPATTKEKA